MAHFHQVPLRVLPVDHPDKTVPGIYIGAASAASARHRASLASSIPSSTSSTSSSTADLAADFQGDLLPDLWQTTSSTSAVSTSPGLHMDLSVSPSTLAPGVWQAPSTRMPGPSSYQPSYGTPDYAHSLLPNNLYSDLGAVAPVPALTEENLRYNGGQPPAAMAPAYGHLEEAEDLFSFEQQQQVHHQPQHVPAANPSPAYAPLHSNRRHKPTTSSPHTAEPSPKASAPPQQPVNTQLYKTELCASYMKMGLCPYGNKCQFAHGENELKRVERPPKWRSKPCANWSKFGTCRYGNRCCFKHEN